MCAASVYPEPGSNSLVNGIYSSHISMLPIYLFLSYLALYFADHFFIDSLLLSSFIGFFSQRFIVYFSMYFFVVFSWVTTIFILAQQFYKVNTFFKFF